MLRNVSFQCWGKFIIISKLQWNILRRKKWSVDNFKFGETSVIDVVSNSVWVNTSKTSFFICSAKNSLWSLERFSWWIWLTSCKIMVLLKESESTWSLSWGEKSLKRCTWKRWEAVALKKFLSQSSGFSFSAWRTFVKSNRNAAIWDCLHNFEDFVDSMWEPGEDINNTVRWIWEESF